MADPDPILAIFFLKDGEKIANGLQKLGSGPSERASLAVVARDVNIMLGSYLRAQIILSGLTMISYTVVLSLTSVPYAFVRGQLAGLFEFVPVVGPAVAAVTVFVIAILAASTHLVWMFSSGCLALDAGLRQRALHQGRVA